MRTWYGICKRGPQLRRPRGLYPEIYNSGDTECSLLGFRLDDSDEFDDLFFGDVTLALELIGSAMRILMGVSALASEVEETVWLSDPDGNSAMVTLLPSVESGGVSLSQSFDADGTGYCATYPWPGQ